VRRVFGPRTAVEAAFLVAVPVTALAGGLGRAAIIAVSAVGYLLVLLVEAVLWRERPGNAVVPRPQAPAEPVVVPVEPREAAGEPDPEPEPEPEPPPDPEPDPEPVRVLQPVPDLEPEPEPEPEPLQVATTVVPIGISAQPRQWNIWDLERLTREASGSDMTLDEERSFLLMYLRDFAGPDGELPIDFDGLVRDSFGELVGAR
jgi:outer membrane biosynthesis protein TonB